MTRRTCPRPARSSGLGGGTKPPAPGRYELSVQLKDPRQVVVPLGTLVVDGDGEMTLTPP